PRYTNSLIFLFVLYIFLGSPFLFAEETHPVSDEVKPKKEKIPYILTVPNWFLGVGPEVNGFTRMTSDEDKIAFGGNFIWGVHFLKDFGTGVKVTYFNNFDTVGAFEAAAFFRYYFPFKKRGLFAQAEAGLALLFEYGYTFTAFTGGLRAGWRFNIKDRFYIEPSARLGYPYVWGAGVMVGINFNIKTKPKEEKKEEQVLESSNGIVIIKESENLTRIQVSSIIFRSDNADFDGLSAEILQNNFVTLGRMAQILNMYSGYKVLVEGHANPTTPDKSAAREREQAILQRLSEQRALRIVEELVKLGVDRSRLTYVGAGVTNLAAPWNDAENNWKNRRVEFILTR
ncbi:MAG: OmpA family protein, partial [Treponema sp.]|nr:OmpA family protein [Treponema sp.]